MKSLLCLLIVAVNFLRASPVLAEIKVAVLHPLLGDLARQVGGKDVIVLDLLKPGAEPHHFEPSARDLASLRGSRLILASGKGLEGYLGRVGEALGGGMTIVEVGKTLPSLKSSTGHLDPHWWHSPDNMKRAASVVAGALSEIDPAHEDIYKANAAAAARRFDALKRWAQQELALIPRKDRILVSAHNAFAYFCKEFGFRTVPVLGLAAEDEPSPRYITDAIQIVRENRVRAVFPEEQASPKTLAAIARETGVKVGTPLNADGSSAGAGSTFEGMFRHNVEAIVSALKP